MDAVTAAPFVVPVVEYGSSLWWWLGFEEGWVDLDSGGLWTRAFRFARFPWRRVEGHGLS